MSVSTFPARCPGRLPQRRTKRRRHRNSTDRYREGRRCQRHRIGCSPAFTVSGVVTFDGTPPSPMPPIDIALVSSGSFGSGRSRVKSDGSFQITGVSPGALTLSMPRSGPLYLKTAWYGNLDVTSTRSQFAAGDGTPHHHGDRCRRNPWNGAAGKCGLGNTRSGSPLPEEAYAAREDMQRQTPDQPAAALLYPTCRRGTTKSSPCKPRISATCIIAT